MFNWNAKKDQAFSTIRCLRKIREYHIKEMKRLRDIDAIAGNVKLSVKKNAGGTIKRQGKSKRKLINFLSNFVQFFVVPSLNFFSVIIKFFCKEKEIVKKMESFNIIPTTSSTNTCPI